MENLPTYISVIFGLTALLNVAIFYKASKNSKKTLLILLSWLTIQAVVSLIGFYAVITSTPPRFLLLILPPLLIILILFATTKGRQYIDQLDEKTLTILHTVRVPVELVLYWLFLNKAVPELMTFEGRNFDILAGLTAPLIFYFGFVKNGIGKKMILIWNFICLGL